MREIKFRAWDADAKDMISWNEIIHSEPNSGLNMQEILLSQPFIPMQYTGLQDKNGKDIYEGDILRIAEWKMNGEVNFASGMFKVRDRRREIFNPSLASFMVEIRCEVIGNIWENADLLRDSAIESTELPKP